MNSLAARYGLVIAAGLVAVLFSTSLPALWRVWWDTGTFNHCLIVIPAAAWLIWDQERLIAGSPGARAVSPEANMGEGRSASGLLASLLHWRYLPLGLLLDLAILWFVARLLSIQVLEQAALVAMVPTLAWAWNGHAWARRHRFALLFCLLATPVGEFLVPHLMELTADLTVLLVKLCGIPVLRDGMRLSLASGDFVVAEACSGIRYLIASVTLGLLFAHLSYRTWRRKLWFMVAAVLVPLLANGLRAWLMVMIAHFSDLQYATGFDHLVYGWVFFGVVMLILFAVGSRFVEPAVAATASGAYVAPAVPASTRTPMRPATFTAVLLLAWAPLAESGANRYFATIDGDLAPHAFPTEFAGHRQAGLAPFPTPLVYPGADRIDSAVYRLPGEEGSPPMHYAVVRFERDRPGHKFVSQVNKPWDTQWDRTRSGHEVFAGGLRRFDDLSPEYHELGVSSGGAWRVYTWYTASGEATTSPLRAKWLALRDWLKPRAAQDPPTIHVVAVARPVAGHEDITGT